MNNSYTSQVNDYLQGGQARQNGAFANMVPRQTVIGNQPHMLAYINPAEEGMLQEYRNDAPVFAGPDGVPAYGFYEALTGKKFEDTAVGSALGVKSDSTFGSEGSADKAYDFITNDNDLFANIGGDYGDPKPEYDLSGTTDTSDSVAGFIPDDTLVSSRVFGPTTERVTIYKDGDSSEVSAGLVSAFQAMGWSITPPAYTNTTVITDGSGLMDQLAADTALTNVGTDIPTFANYKDAIDAGYLDKEVIINGQNVIAKMDSGYTGTGTGAGTGTDTTLNVVDTTGTGTGTLTNVGTGAAGTGDASTKGFYETATGKKFEDTFAGELIGVTDDSLLGSEGAADAAFTSFTDLVDGGGKGASGDEFEGNGALSNIIASTANALGVSTFDEDAGLAGGEGSVYDVLTDVISPTKIITNVLTGGEGVAGTIGNALEGTAPGEFLEDNIPYIANQLRIDNEFVDNDEYNLNYDPTGGNTTIGALPTTTTTLTDAQKAAYEQYADTMTDAGVLSLGGKQTPEGPAIVGNTPILEYSDGGYTVVGGLTEGEDPSLSYNADGTVFVPYGGEDPHTITAETAFIGSTDPNAEDYNMSLDFVETGTFVDLSGNTVTGNAFETDLTPNGAAVLNELGKDNLLKTGDDSKMIVGVEGGGIQYTDGTPITNDIFENAITEAVDDGILSEDVLEVFDLEDETIAPITSTSGPTRTDRTTDEMLDYTRRYIKDFSSHLPEYLRRFTVGEPIDGMFNEFVGEDGKTYYRTAEGEIYDAEKFANAAVGETASVGTGEEIVVGYTETDADGNSIDYDNEGNQLDGSDERDGDGGVQVPAPFAPPSWTTTEGAMGAAVITQFWNPETGERYASRTSNERPPEGSPWTSVQPDETPEGGWDFWLPPFSPSNGTKAV